MYSGSNISWKFFLMGFGNILLTLMFFVLALWCYEAPPEDGGETGSEREEDKKSRLADETTRPDRNMNRMISNSSQVAIVANESLPETDDVFEAERAKKPRNVYYISYV